MSSRFFKADFTRDERLVFPLREASLQTPYSDCQHPERTLLAYSPEEILAEKLCALLSRTEPRDLYDVHFILANDLADVEAMALHLGQKMSAKGLSATELRDILTRKRETFNRLWELRLRGQMPDLPQIDAVIRETNRSLRQLVAG